MVVKIEFTPLSLDRKIFPFKKGFKKDSAVVVDFSVIIQRYAGVLEGKSATFLKLYEMIEKHVRRLFRVYKFIRVDLVMDFYYSLSLKSSRRSV